MILKFIEGYVECALWSSDVGVAPDYWNVNNIDLASWVNIIEECETFLEEHDDDIDSDNFIGVVGSIYSYAGHDFWLTRVRSGAGFNDGDWDEEIGERMTSTAKRMGSRYVYLGDDLQIHFASD